MCYQYSSACQNLHLKIELHVQSTSQDTYVALIFTGSSCTRCCETLCAWLTGTYSCYFLVKPFVTWFTYLHVLRF